MGWKSSDGMGTDDLLKWILGEGEHLNVHWVMYGLWEKGHGPVATV